MQLITEMCSEGILKRVPKGLQILDWKSLEDLADEVHEEKPW